ncbi:MAG: ABC transporter permease [Patescibacteria group bacterium]|nr:ABC transporter permease [Patescibacteria group bacterium]MDD5294663.1 ABC transporter permease [Patescibacteria group bacterium]MDD5554578.1 ABC transporter permease [Patescibacteria group bacterium]
MNIRSTIKISWQAMHANKVRTGLTVLGMVIGIASVIIVFSAGEGINNLILGEVESFGGSDIIETEIKVPSTKKGTAGEAQSGANLATGVQVTTLTLKDMEDINKLPNINQGYAGIMGQEQVSYGNELKKAFLFGTSASFIDIDKSEIDIGRFFTDAEDKSLAPVAILGSKMKEKLFGDSDPIGQFIKIRQKKFRVIGVLKERGAVMTVDFDDFVYVPVRTLQKRIMGIDNVTFLMHQVKDTNLLDETAEEMRAILRENHDIPPPEEAVTTIFGSGKDDFRVVSMVESMEVMKTVTGAITLLLLAIVAISLVVGGVGITNIMYVIVTERTKEIGLRKAVGAKYADIMWQFLTESILITIAGGVVGIILGAGVSLLISLGASYYGLDWGFSVPLKSFVVSLGFSLFFGVAFGLYPARKAAKLEPVEALGHE